MMELKAWAEFDVECFAEIKVFRELVASYQWLANCA